MNIEPLSISDSRNNAFIKEDLPAPVRPTTPTLLPGKIFKLTLRTTLGRSDRWRIEIFYNCKCPLLGQVPGIGSKSLASGGSSSSLVYSCIRSTLARELEASIAKRIEY